MKNIKIRIFLAMLPFLWSCEKLVEIDPPQDYLISPTVFESDETATSATTGVYAMMMRSDLAFSYNIALYTGVYSDELDYNQTLQSVLSVSKYAMLPQDAPTNNMWNYGFNYIYQANSLIDGLSKATKISPAVKNQLLGEAYFTRAFWHFYLSNLYGPLPLILSTNYTENAKIPRSEVGKIQTQIVEDLNKAKGLLTEKYVAGNSFTESADRIRPNTFVASALLARIYLQMKDFSNAQLESNRIIANTKYDIVDLAAVFKRTSKEVIWQLELPVAGYFNSYEALYFQLTAKPSQVSSTNCSTLSKDLLSLFAPTDKRRTTWTGTITDNTVTPAAQFVFPAKLKNKTSPADEYTTPFRLAEVYLIRAEARANLGLIDDAINDTDKIRSRAGLLLLKNITPGITKEALLDSINNERRRELFCEWGSRWMDIKRSANSDGLMKAIAARKGATWKSTAILWPLPLNEVLNSANILKQNDGYN